MKKKLKSKKYEEGEGDQWFEIYQFVCANQNKKGTYRDAIDDLVEEFEIPKGIWL